VDSESVIPASTSLILSGKLLAPAGKRIQSDIATYNLYSAIHQTGQTPVDADQWLNNRLRQLGVQSAEDLALLSAEDLTFVDFPTWEKEKFEQTYPRKVKLANLHMTVQYDPKKKQVTLEKISGVRKNQPQRKELPLWAGWSIRYRDGSKVVDISK
jgi:hypothetical protein